MFIPRDCQSQFFCNPSYDPTQQSGTVYHAYGSQRYIGVVMVAAGIVLALALWIWLAAWPKKALSTYCWGRWQKPKCESNNNVVIDLSASQPDLKKPKRVRIMESQDTEQGEIQASASLSKRDSGSEHEPNGKLQKLEKRRRDHKVSGLVRHEAQNLG